jgi:hypothetical protein
MALLYERSKPGRSIGPAASFRKVFWKIRYGRITRGNLQLYGKILACRETMYQGFLLLAESTAIYKPRCAIT